MAKRAFRPEHEACRICYVRKAEHGSAEYVGHEFEGNGHEAAVSPKILLMTEEQRKKYIVQYNMGFKFAGLASTRKWEERTGGGLLDRADELGLSNSDAWMDGYLDEANRVKWHFWYCTAQTCKDAGHWPQGE